MSPGDTAPSPANSEAALGRQVNRILLATDLSARSDRALARAIELARGLSAQLTVFHVFDDDLPKSVHEQVSQAAREEIVASLRRCQAPEEVAIEVRAGKDYGDIIDASQRHAADLLVMGVHRNENRSKPVRGTTMEKVIRLGDRPVLVVAEPVDTAYQRVAVAVDFSVHARIALRCALAVAPRAEIHCVHAFHVPFAGFNWDRETSRGVAQEHEKRLTQVIDEELDAVIAAALSKGEAHPTIHKVLKDGAVSSVLRSETERLKPDLLVLGTHGRVGVARALLGSVAEDFLNEPPCDVLAVKAW